MKNVFKELNKNIQAIAGKLLAENRVDLVLGYGRGEMSGEVTPIFVREKKQAEDLLFNEHAWMMLAKYVLKYKGERVAVIAKPCDTRALVSYLAEGLVDRGNLMIIGIGGCPGMEGNTACEECTVRNPVLEDIHAGDLEAGEGQLGQTVAELERMSPQERLIYFQKEFSRCLRCYACREACFVCYCPECFTDSNRPFWVGKSTASLDNFTFHLLRSMHMAGRCINCGACEMACPEGIDVRALAAKLYQASKDIYGFEPGLDPAEKTLLADYRINDPQPGFLE